MAKYPLRISWRVWPLIACLGALAGGQALPRVREAVNNQQVVRERGGVPAALRAAVDLGTAPPALPMRRMLLLLRRSPQQSVELAQWLADQQTPGAPAYHHWLSPQQFGARFGPAPADVDAVTNWLEQEGLSVDRVAAGRNVIEFSGTAAAVSHAFHTAMHRYRAGGRAHWSNAVDPAIPAALTPVVAGVVSLNDFEKPAGHLRGWGEGRRAQADSSAPAFNFTGHNSQPEHALVPADFATLYNATPLYAAGVTGKGASIAVVGRSEINLQDVLDFRSLFVPSNPAKLPQIVVNGPDPGETGGGDEDEADLDVEWAGAVAPDATVIYVVSATTDTTDGVDLSAEYVVDHNLAAVMTTSYAACEAVLGTQENAFIAALYEQAAAQGITVIDSAGDTGAAGCDPNDGSEAAANAGKGVNGLASTPYDTAVGGSQMGADGDSYWAASSNPQTFASLTGPFPEAAWNESCLNPGCDPGAPLSASGGGASVLYAKPVWQQAPGVPGDHARDVPDIALAAAGDDGYVACEANACTVDNQGNFGFAVFSGTSASAPAFAGVMALVNQEAGARQGNANFTLYELAQHQQDWSSCDASTAPASSLAHCIFRDVTQGNNSVPCRGGSPDCSATSNAPNTQGVLPGYDAGPGYDQVTGLGSVNIANLVGAWSSATAPLATTTTLHLDSTTLTHGESVMVAVTVTAADGAAIPAGDIALLALTGGGETGINAGTLAQGGNCNAGACAQGTINWLPGGSYNLVARFAGSAGFAPSLSAPVAVEVAPEGSATILAAYTADAAGYPHPATGAVYGSPLWINTRVQATASPGEGAPPTGTISLTNHGASFSPPGFPAALALNSEGMAEFPGGVSTLTPADYQLTAAYSGDAGYAPSESPALALTITRAPVRLAVSSQPAGGAVQLTATLGTTSLGAPPSGTISFYAGSDLLGSSTVAGSRNPANGYAAGEATLTVAATAAAGAALSAQYAGDANYAGSAPFVLAAAAEAATVSAGASTSDALVLSAVNGFAGAVALTCQGAPAGTTCSISPASVTLTAAAPSARAELTVTASGARNAAAPHPGPARRLPAALWLLVVVGLALALTGRRRRLALLVGAAALAAACGGAGGGGLSAAAAAPPTGHYTLAVTATSGAATTTLPLALTINSQQ